METTVQERPLSHKLFSGVCTVKQVLAIKCDVTSTENINAAAQMVEEEFGRVDILLNCAGASKDKGVIDMTDEEWDFTIATDETSVFKMTRAFAAIMKKHK